MAKEKEKQDEFELALSGSDLSPSEFLENVEVENDRPPTLILVQSMSELVEFGDAKPGQIVYSETEKAYGKQGEALAVIPLYYWPGRTFFPPRDSGSTMPICRSLDAKTGVGLPGGNCLQCTEKDWTKDGERNVPPSCKFSHNFAVLVPSTMEVAVVTLQKTSEKAGKAILNRLRQMKNPMFSYVFNLVGKVEESTLGRYWVWDLEKHSDTNKLEKPLNLFDDKNWKTLLEEAKAAAIKIRSDHKNAIERLTTSLPEDGNETEVPF